MRYRLMATYRGSPYEAGVGPADGTVVLFAACPPPEELGFEPATGYWRKELPLSDVQAVWQSRPVGRFRGERCIVLDDLGDRLHIGYLGHDAYRAEELGYWQVDRGVFELVAARDEVTDIVEERTDYPGAASGSYPTPMPVTADYGRPAPHSGPQAVTVSAPRTAPQPVRPAAGPGARNGPGTRNGSGVMNGPGIPAGHGVALPAPPVSGTPLPLEAEALRAASASSSSRRDAWAGSESRDALAAPGPTVAPARTVAPVTPVPPGGFVPAADSPPRRRRSARKRTATEQIFSELAGQAAIPASSYSVGEEVDGAMCLLETPSGFEVFSCSGGARHEVRVFSDEESACFYLFGVLAAEAVRTGALAPGPAAAFAGEGLSRR
jgi:hypothetical protein